MVEKGPTLTPGTGGNGEEFDRAAFSKFQEIEDRIAKGGGIDLDKELGGSGIGAAIHAAADQLDAVDENATGDSAIISSAHEHDDAVGGGAKEKRTRIHVYKDGEKQNVVANLTARIDALPSSVPPEVKELFRHQAATITNSSDTAQISNRLLAIEGGNQASADSGKARLKIKKRDKGAIAAEPAPAAPAAPAATPRTPDPIVPPAVVIPPIPVITGAMPAGITSAQVEELNRQIAERNNAMAAEIASLNERLARHATTEASAAVIAERDALRTIHGVRDADASRVLQIAHEKFAPQAIPADATPDQRERIERSNALSAKTLRTLEKRRYELRVKAEKIPTDAGKGAVLDALRNHLALPWWKRFGSSAAITSVGALTGYGAMSALTTYAGLGTLSFLGALAGAPLLTGGAIVGGTFAHLYKRFHHQNAIGQGRSALLHKSPMTSAAVLSLIIGGGKLALWNSPQGTAIIGALSKKLSLLTHGAFDSILHMFSSAPRPRVPIGKGPTLRL